MSVEYKHTPVMLNEVLEYSDPKLGQYFIDCTLGGAGYTIAIAKMVGEDGKVLAIDLDEMAIKNAERKIKSVKLDNIILVQDNFRNLLKIANKNFKNKKVDGIVLDLGFSSAQLDDKNRGFSFQLDAPLNMAFGDIIDDRQNSTEYIVNNLKEYELRKIISEYGEERFAERIARNIVESRKIKRIETTGQLVEIIKGAVPKKYLYSKIHPATRTFQALRIATNNELENLKEVLPQALSLLRKGGKLVVISFHSLEDRIVKHFFKKEARDCVCSPDCLICQCGHKKQIKILTKRIIRAGEEEVRDNPRSRSAKLRAVERI